MAPNVDSESNSELSQLEQIEETLHRLQKNTLKIKRKNNDIIRTFDRGATGNRPRPAPRQHGGETSEMGAGAMDPSGLPIKPPRKLSKPQLLPEVEQTLKECAEMRRKMQDTLKSCPADRERHRRYLQDMKNESQKAFLPLHNVSNLQQPVTNTSTRAAPLALNPCEINPAFSVFTGIKAGLKGVFQKLSYSDTNSKSQQPPLNIQNKSSNSQRLPPNAQELSSKTQLADSSMVKPKIAASGSYEQNQEDQSFVFVTSEDIEAPSGLMIRHSTPKPKPRRLKSSSQTGTGQSLAATKSSSSNIVTKPRVPPPPPPMEKVTYEQLQKMYQDNDVTTEEDSTIPRPPRRPVPRPRTQVPTTQNLITSVPSDYVGSELEESTSEFEFVQAPLLVQTVQVSEDSDESLMMIKNNKSKHIESVKLCDTSKGYVKSRKSSCVPKAYKKPKQTTSEAEKVVVSLIPEPKKKVIPLSPPPKKFTRTSSLTTVTLQNLSEEDSSVPSSPTTQLLAIPVTPTLKTPPPTISKNDIDFEFTKDNTNMYPTLPVHYEETRHRTSALCLGVPVSSIDIPVIPWTTNNRRQSQLGISERWHKEYVQPETNADVYLSPSFDAKKTAEEMVMQKSITENFAFLDSEKEEDLQPQDELSETQNPPSVDSMNSIPNDAFKGTSDSPQKIEAVKDVLVNISKKDLTELWNVSVDTIQDIFNEVQRSTLYIQDVPLVHELATTTEEQLATEATDKSNPTELPEFKSDCQGPPPLPLTGPPPPPPAMPIAPIYANSCNSSYKKLNNLPITPLDNVSCQETVFDKMLKNGSEEFNIDLKFITANFSSVEASDSKSPTNRRATIGSILPTDTSSNLSSPSEAPLLSLNRRQVVAIGIRKIKLPVDHIIRALKRLDFDKISADDIQILLQILPKENEQSMFQTLDGSKCETLCKEDQIMKSLSEIPQVEVKLKAINYILTFDETLEALKSDIALLESASKSIKDSTKFPKMLEIVLLVINKAFVKDGEPVKGFEIQSLQRLTKKKTKDGKVTLLHCIVKCLQDYIPDAVLFYEDFVDVEEASKISVKDVSKRLEETENGLEQIRSEIHGVQNGNSSVDVGTHTIDSAFKAARFVLDAAKKLTTLKSQWERTLNSLQKVMQYFGVSNNKTMDSKDFFRMISGFVNDYKKTLHQKETLLQAFVSDKKDTSSKQGRSPSGTNSTEPVAFRRQSISTSSAAVRQNRVSLSNDPSNFGEEIRRESGQPSEFIDAVLFMGQTQGNQGQGQSECRIRRSASFYTPRPFSRKKLTPAFQNPNRER